MRLEQETTLTNFFKNVFAELYTSLWATLYIDQYSQNNTPFKYNWIFVKLINKLLLHQPKCVRIKIKTIQRDFEIDLEISTSIWHKQHNCKMFWF